VGCLVSPRGSGGVTRRTCSNQILDAHREDEGTNDRNHDGERRKDEETLVMGRENALPHGRFSVDNHRVKLVNQSTLARLSHSWSNILFLHYFWEVVPLQEP